MNYASLIAAISDAHQRAWSGAAGAVNRHLILQISASAMRKFNDTAPTPLPPERLLQLLWTHWIDPLNISDLIRDPYVLEFTGIGDQARFQNSDLEATLLNA